MPGGDLCSDKKKAGYEREYQGTGSEDVTQETGNAKTRECFVITGQQVGPRGAGSGARVGGDVTQVAGGQVLAQVALRAQHPCRPFLGVMGNNRTAGKLTCVL